MSDEKTNPDRGWKMLINSPKAHYFVHGRSLCGRWASLGREFEDFNHDSPDNCKPCRAKRDKLVLRENISNPAVEIKEKQQ